MRQGFPRSTSPGARSTRPGPGKASWRGSHEPREVPRRHHNRGKRKGFSSWFGAWPCCLDDVPGIFVLIRHGQVTERQLPWGKKTIWEVYYFQFPRGEGTTQGHIGKHQGRRRRRREHGPGPPCVFQGKEQVRQGRQV